MSKAKAANDTAVRSAVEVWQCIGCGRIEAPQPCIGVCQDRKVVLVGKAEHDQALDDIAQLQARIDTLRALLTRFTRATPRKGGWQASWEQLQAHAHKALDDDARAAGVNPPARRNTGR